MFDGVHGHRRVDHVLAGVVSGRQCLSIALVVFIGGLFVVREQSVGDAVQCCVHGRHQCHGTVVHQCRCRVAVAVECVDGFSLVPPHHQRGSGVWGALHHEWFSGVDFFGQPWGQRDQDGGGKSGPDGRDCLGQQWCGGATGESGGRIVKSKARVPILQFSF